ncbi:hypothetical protein [Streptacidiphilus jiangxiensis]|nr:hypothetical protein [Streptacidiphilus jiangxiensis]
MPGDLAYFEGHVGILIGKSAKTVQILAAPHAYDHVQRTNTWTLAYVRTNHAGLSTVQGFYRYVPPTTGPSPSPSPSLPHLAASYSGTVHNITYNIDSTFGLSSITEDAQGHIAGQMTVAPPLYGSGSFSGTVTATSINFTVTSTTPNPAGAVSIAFVGTISPTSMAGTYTVQATGGTQTGSWQLNGSTG